VTPDGKTLLLSTSTSENQEDLWVVPLAKPKEAKPFLATKFYESDATLSSEVAGSRTNLRSRAERRFMCVIFLLAATAFRFLPMVEWNVCEQRTAKNCSTVLAKN
jgi:hypothetical protein